MKDMEQIERWLHGTLRAWRATDSDELEKRLYAEALALIWVLHEDATWAGARTIFEEMRAKLDEELGPNIVEAAP